MTNRWHRIGAVLRLRIEINAVAGSEREEPPRLTAEEFSALLAKQDPTASADGMASAPLPGSFSE